MWPYRTFRFQRILERPDITSTTYWDWLLDHDCDISATACVASRIT